MSIESGSSSPLEDPDLFNRLAECESDPRLREQLLEGAAIHKALISGVEVVEIVEMYGGIDEIERRAGPEAAHGIKIILEM